MLDILKRWNRWGGASLKSGIERDILPTIKQCLDTPEIIALIGPRRAGKTTVLFQIMDQLEQAGVPLEAMLHINLEEPAFSPELSIELLEKLYRLFRAELYPEGKVYLFLDEIQNVPQWERWLRARNESEDIKIFVTGSSSQMMSRELGTLLTGRHLSFKVFPLSFREFLRFKKIVLPTELLKTNATPQIQNALDSYLRWGGLPEVVLAADDAIKELLLKQYFDDILFKDIVMRHKIRDVFTLRNIAVFLLTQTGSLISLQRIAKIFETSLDLARSYCQYLQEAFLVDFVMYYSNKTTERMRNPQKVYAVDTGLRYIANMAHSADRGHIVETAVFHVLQAQKNDGVFYWKKQVEVDFVIRFGNQITDLIQVVAENLGLDEIQKREFRVLDEAQKNFPKAKSKIIVEVLPKNILAEKDIMELIPLWYFLLNQ